jgi:hypothetical protein
MNRSTGHAGVLLLLLATVFGGTGCLSGPCECSWEGGQRFELLAASRAGSVVFVAVRHSGSPCCEDEWTRERTLRVDLSGDLARVVASDVETAGGDRLEIGEGDRIALPDLGLALQVDPALGDVSVGRETVELFLILALPSEERRGVVEVSAGPGAG